MGDSDGGRGEGEGRVAGGRRRGGRPKKVPRGIETLIKRAAIDPAFRERLFEDRSQAAREMGLQLTMAESIVLGTVRDAQLHAMIDAMQVSDEERRALLDRAPLPDADSTPASPTTLGIQPDPAEGGYEPRTRGIRPDLPGITPRSRQSKGIRPDDE